MRPAQFLPDRLARYVEMFANRVFIESKMGTSASTLEQATRASRELHP
jgi:hypothetical protein